MENINLRDFIKKCMTEKIGQSDMHNFVQMHTNNFDTTKLELLKNDLNDITKAIKFIIIDGDTDKITTIEKYIEDFFDFSEIDVFDFPVLKNPRAKLNFVINDIEERGLNFEVKGYKYEIIEDDYIGFFNLCDIAFNLEKIEQIYGKQKNEIVPETATKNTPKRAFNKEHSFPTIDTKKYNADLIFEKFNNVVFKCSKECFFAWLVDGIEYPETIEYILKGRISIKTGLKTLNFAQLRKFIDKITGTTETAKDAYYKAIFGLNIKTSTIPSATNLNETFKDLKKCEVK